MLLFVYGVRQLGYNIYYTKPATVNVYGDSLWFCIIKIDAYKYTDVSDQQADINILSEYIFSGLVGSNQK